ncbi:SDR family NAD(P)-dependent oxidoreductase [Granulicella sp. S190]|uniref:SDR family NAD(P)-dependent oxidoreductase n=1 Tax=Granulicella sp. S190 TaxID=1747226 RepID=UPI00131D19D1|nr:SDR family NAD(P)-dependent oxidoreductase [Granulicella sp. S190]
MNFHSALSVVRRRLTRAVDPVQQATLVERNPTDDSDRPSVEKPMPDSGSADSLRQGPPLAEIEPIAIIGMSGRFPKSKDPDDLWRNLIAERDCVGVLPPDRWGTVPHIRHAGVMEGLDEFDPLFFGISPREAQAMDPQHRLLMTHVYKVIEDAGHSVEGLSGSDTGLFMAMFASGYRNLLSQAGEAIEGHSAAAMWGAMGPNRMSYWLNWHGPSELLDTACSSSLVAVHRAIQSLRSGECSQAVVGGINTLLWSDFHEGLSRTGMLSPGGRCKSFSAQADGFVRGEGIGMLFLKPLSAAERDGDHIYGLIRGSAVNHGGRAKSLTAPNPRAQADLIKMVLTRAGVNPGTIGYVEAHGTGTELGDPIEIQGLKSAFTELDKGLEKGTCGIGSIKSNIGHLEVAAGVVGLIKVLLQLKYQTLVKSLHCDELNPYIDFDDSPFFVVQKTQPWVAFRDSAGHSLPRRAGVSSFGFGGVNAHVIVEEYLQPADAPQTPVAYPLLIVLSARRTEDLKIKAEQLLEHINRHVDVNLADLAYTLQVGREALRVRLGFAAHSLDQAKAKLQAYLDEETQNEEIFLGEVESSSEGWKGFTSDDEMAAMIRSWLARGLAKSNAAKLLKGWTVGLSVSWGELYGDRRPKRISLPTYPFSRERYWPHGDSSEVKDSLQVESPSLSHETEPTKKPVAEMVLDKVTEFREKLDSMLTGDLMLAPVWDPAIIVSNSAWPLTTERVAILGGDEEQHAALRTMFPDAQVLSASSASSIGQQLESTSTISHLLWLCPVADETEAGEIARQQEQGVILGYRIMKALLRLGYEDRALGVTVVTHGAHVVRPSEANHPSHAGVHGLCGSLAKECPKWRIRVVDADGNRDVPFREIFSLPPDETGGAWAYRNGQWHRQRLVVCDVPDPKISAYRCAGVYVILGGAGGLGEALTEYLIRGYQAQVVWIGRRAQDDAITAKIERLAALGPAPHYVSADARDRNALRRAWTAIRARYGTVHGVVHSIVTLANQSLRRMEEEQLVSVLAAKVDTSLWLGELLKEEPLDFVLFFSSIQSFTKHPGLSNYAAACSFQDAWSSHLARTLKCSVKTMNWGYWGSVGVVATEAYRERVQQAGWGSVEAVPAMEALEKLLAGPFRQLAFWNVTDPSAIEILGVSQRMFRADHEAISISTELKPESTGRALQEEINRWNAAGSYQTFQSLLFELLSAQLYEIGGWEDAASVKDWSNSVQMPGFYAGWLQESLTLLNERGYVVYDNELCHFTEKGRRDSSAIWRQWQERKNIWRDDVFFKAKAELAEKALKAIPAILTGRTLATEVLFPNSSMELVEGVYKNNPVADYFNEAVADFVEKYVKEVGKYRTDIRLRILEIGAGTGGTTASVLRRLTKHKERMEEYCYTDLSPAFLRHAERNYGQENPFLSYGILDAELPFDGQSIDIGSYDIVIATNVLHATRNIHATVRNAKSALKANGFLLLNEITDKDIFAQVTFGLLKGFWLCEDNAIRISGSPVLTPESWLSVLEKEGFHSIGFPVRAARQLGQQVIVGQSDGLIRQEFARGQKPVDSKPEQHSGSVSVKEVTAEIRPSIATKSVDEGTLRAEVQHTIREKVSQFLRMSIDGIQPNGSFADYGVDSITVVQLVQEINEIFRLNLMSTILFDYSSVDKLTTYLLSEHGAELAFLLQESQSESHEVQPEISSGKDKPTDRAGKAAEFSVGIDRGEKDRDEPIAIIGLSARYAGSKNAEELWQHLASGDDLVRPVSRWDLSQWTPRDGDCRDGGFLDEIDRFDPQFFNISGTEATYMDPSQRIFLEESWKALEDAGYAGNQVEGTRCGVYAGYCGGDYFDEHLATPETPAQALWGNAPSLLSSRISYYLNLRGPAITIDSACSSSLVAMHLACQSLWRGEIDLALAGGVSMECTPDFYIAANRAGMLSPSGRCRTFDNRADGFVPGEGCGVLVLKRLSRALADRDHIHGTIRASGVNQDGATNGITAPSMLSQEQLISHVYEISGIHPEEIQMVETHGTGTKLGDPIEYNALKNVFQQYTNVEQYCAIGSIKTNLGHTTAAAGVAGVIKVLLSLQHRQIPPSLHFERSNEHISFEHSPFYVNRNLRSWEVKAGGLRHGAVSSFGLSGTNAHMVVEEAPPAVRTSADVPAYLIALSARTPEQLRQQVEQFLRYCAATADVNYGDCSFTLLTGRKHLACCLACVVDANDSPMAALEHWLSHGKASGISSWDDAKQPIRVSMEKRGREILDTFDWCLDSTEYRERLTTIATLYSQGYSLPYEKIFAGTQYKRVSLPTYPFRGDKFWIPEHKESRRKIESARTAVAEVSPSANSEAMTEPKMTQHELRLALQEKLLRIISQLLMLPAEDLDVNEGFYQLGFDSITLAALSGEINKVGGLDLTPALFFEHSTIAMVADYLVVEHPVVALRLTKASEEKKGSHPEEQAASDLSGDTSSTESEALRPADGAPVKESASNSIAVIGMSGRFPGAADVGQLWKNLVEGRDSITEIPHARWDWKAVWGDPASEEEKTNIRWGGFIDGIDDFDPMFFNITPREAEMMDPQQRLLMTHVWQAIEDAGYAPASLAGSRTAVLIGMMPGGYSGLLASASVGLNAYSVTNSLTSLGPNRISYLLDLHGPSEPVETGCSSSLVAVHRAIQLLVNNECDLAIVGGVNTILTPEGHISLSKAGMLAQDGRCKAFAAGADGYVRSEGIAVLVLKRLEAAEKDGDHIYGLLVGSAENHGGRASSLTAPNMTAQAEVILRAHLLAGTDPRTVAYLETHGTGTSLGDPVEINGIKSAFQKLHEAKALSNDSRMPCGLGSVKSNLGHLEMAAGVTGLVKVLLQMKHRTLVKTLHSERLNPYLQLEDGPFYVVQHNQPWLSFEDSQGRQIPRRAGVSSFGAGGVNTHVVLEEYAPVQKATLKQKDARPALVVLSARDEERLKDQARQLLDALASPEFGQARLADVAYTLQVGRNAMDHRLAMYVTDIDELRDKLGQVVSGAERSDAIWRGVVRNRRDNVDVVNLQKETDKAIQLWIEKSQYEAILDLWVRGAVIPWDALYGAGRPRRISLPTYPFARERYWVPATKVSGPTASANTSYPLLQLAEPAVGDRVYRSRIATENILLADHIVQGKSVLPATVHLEIAREAAQALWKIPSTSVVPLRLYQIAWMHPVIAEGIEVDLRLSLSEEGPGHVRYELCTMDAETGDVAVHSQGQMQLGSAYERSRLDLMRLRELCAESHLSGQDFYDMVARSGVHHGVSYQGVEFVDLGRDSQGQEHALAKVVLPRHVRSAKDTYGIHPCLLDAALQVPMAFTQFSGAIHPYLPFSLEEMQIFAEPGEVVWVWARSSNDQSLAGGINKIDLDITDEDGFVMVQIREFVGRSPRVDSLDRHMQNFQDDADVDAEELKDGGNLTLAPFWEAEPVNPWHPSRQEANSNMVVIGGDGEVFDALRRLYPDAKHLNPPACCEVQAIADAIEECGQIDHLVWLAPAVRDRGNEFELIPQAQNEGVKELFRLTKALLQLGYDSRALALTVVTHGTQALRSAWRNDATHAGVHGFVGTLAKEFPQWPVRMIDAQPDGHWDIRTGMNLPPDADGKAWAYRQGEWYRQHLVGCSSSVSVKGRFRQGGVYVLLGGAGGLGKVVTEYLIRMYDARIVWIGRSAPDQELRDSMEHLASVGTMPEYIQADAANRDELASAWRRIKERYGLIHGVIHSALVLADQTIGRMQEDRFAAGLVSKVDTSVWLADIVAEELLDFILFFSSIQSFTMAPGQSNYAAGSVFQDAFAAQLRARVSYPVKVMSWGYWGSVGVVSSEHYRHRMAQLGCSSIEPAEAMQAMENLLAGPLDQQVFVKAMGTQGIQYLDTEEEECLTVLAP